MIDIKKILDTMSRVEKDQVRVGLGQENKRNSILACLAIN